MKKYLFIILVCLISTSTQSKDYKKAFYYLSGANQLKFEKHGSNFEGEKKAINNIIKLFKGINLFAAAIAINRFLI